MHAMSQPTAVPSALAEPVNEAHDDTHRPAS